MKPALSEEPTTNETALARAAFPQALVELHQDLAGLDRVVAVR